MLFQRSRVVSLLVVAGGLLLAFLMLALQPSLELNLSLTFTSAREAQRVVVRQLSPDDFGGPECNDIPGFFTKVQLQILLRVFRAAAAAAGRIPLGPADGELLPWVAEQNGFKTIDDYVASDLEDGEVGDLCYGRQILRERSEGFCWTANGTEDDIKELASLIKELCKLYHYPGY